MKHEVGRKARGEGEAGFLRCFLLVSPAISCARDSWRETVLCTAVYLQIQLSSPEETAEIHYAHTHAYILYQANLAVFAVIALEENPFLSSCLEFSPRSERSQQSEGAQIKIPKGISTDSAPRRRTLRG